MTNLRSRLHFKGLKREVIEFVCALVDMLEFEDRLHAPFVYPYGADGVELVWNVKPNTVRIIVTCPSSYKFILEVEDEGEVLEGQTHSGEQLIHLLRNILFWLWGEPQDEPWL